MDQEKVKLIIRNMELLLDALKSEVYSNIKAYRFDDIEPRELGYDEIFEDDE